MLPIIKILLFSFILINIGILALCIIFHFDFKSSKRIFCTLYLRFFSKSSFLIRKGFFHPILFSRFLFHKIVSMFLFLVKELLNPELIMGTYAILAIIYFSYKTCRILGFGWFVTIIFMLVAFVTLVMLSSRYFNRIWPVLFAPWKKLCYIYMANKNLSDSLYERISGKVPIEKISPDEYSRLREEEFLSFIERVNTPREIKSSKSDKPAVHKITYLDIMYPNELALFGFYMKDFTLEDLKHKKRELLKIHHTDNFREAKDISFHQKKCIEITEAFSIISSAIEKEA